jgi:hypothetical protein
MTVNHSPLDTILFMVLLPERVKWSLPGRAKGASAGETQVSSPVLGHAASPGCRAVIGQDGPTQSGVESVS